MIIHSEQEMLDFGKQFARNLSNQTTITKELLLQSDKEQGDNNSQPAQPTATARGVMPPRVECYVDAVSFA